MHTPVLLKQVIDNLDIRKDGRYIDATYGEGGHSREIVKRGGNVLAIEYDADSINKKVKDRDWMMAGGGWRIEKNIKLVSGNYKDIERIARQNDFVPVDGIMFDLGISMEQISQSGRGFSYQKLNEPLDMRIDTTLKRTAADIVNSYSVHELYEIFSRYSQEIDSRPIAEIISRTRHMKKIQTVGDLVNTIGALMPKKNLESRMRRVFQALRMEVNEELINIKQGISGALEILKTEGKLLVISFNETEDRLVKNIFKADNRISRLVKIKSKSDYRFEKTATLRIAVKTDI